MNTPRTASAASRPGLAALCPSGLARQAAYPGGLLRRERLAEPSFPLPSRRPLARGAPRHPPALAHRPLRVHPPLASPLPGPTPPPPPSPPPSPAHPAAAWPPPLVQRPPDRVHKNRGPCPG